MAAPAIRPLRAEDWAAYRDLRLRALEGAPDAFGATLEESVTYADERWRQLARNADANPLGATFVVDGGEGGLVAACSVRIGEEPNLGRVFAMWVDQDQRGRQLGAQLLAAAEAWAVAAGLHEIRLHVTRGNAPAERVYERAGYRPTGEEQPLRPGSDRVAVELSRRLDPS
jgi:RimJ/RimL family protein N-acetyltransferase